MSANYHHLPSSLLENRQPPWKAFTASVTLQSLAVLLLLGLPLLFPDSIEPLRNYRLTLLLPVSEVPPPPNLKPKPQPAEPVAVAKVEPPEPAVEAPVERKILAPKFTSPVVRPKEKPVRVKNLEAPQIAAASKALDPRLLTGSSATPTLRRPRAEVQTGGFGDPRGVPASAYTGGTPNVAQLGSFDLPTGPGYGNGTGGARGERGVVASAGFGRGVAIGGNASGSNGGTVQTGAFGEQPPLATAPPKPKRPEPEGRLEPVEILAKPRPAYTDAARAAKVEGEVLVEVLFTASGEVVVRRIIRGLGYGLDDSALAAARQIRFRPARRGGQPIDTVGIVHITFQLAE